MPNPPGFIDNVVIGTVHMHVLRGVKGDVIDLIQTSFTEKDVYDALSELHAFMDFDAPGGHHTTMERTAVSLYSKLLVELVWKLDKEKVMISKYCYYWSSSWMLVSIAIIGQAPLMLPALDTSKYCYYWCISPPTDCIGY